MPIKPSIFHIHSFLLLLLGGVLVNQWLQVRALSEQSQLQPLSSNVETLSQEQESLRSELDALSNARFVTADQFENHKNAIAGQLDTLEKPTSSSEDWTSLRSELLVLSAEVESVQKELLKLKQSFEQRPPLPASQPRKPASVKPRQLTPPFAVIGIEYRAGEAFLAVSPKQTIQLSDVQLMRAGDWRGDWQLQSLEPGTVRFALGNGRNHTISLR